MKLAIEGQNSKTQAIQGTNEPVWDEVIIFDIKSGTDTLKLTMLDVESERSRQPIGSVEINLASLSEEDGEID